MRELGSDIFLALPFFFAFTGYYTVSSFYGKGKCKAYDVWVKSERKYDFAYVFVELGEKPTNVTFDHSDLLESFVLQLYGSRHDTLGAARLNKFKKSTDNNLSLLPPNKDALRRHIYRASYQAGYLWRQSVEELDIPDLILSNGVGKQILKEISNLYERIVSLPSRLRISLKLVHVRLESAKAVNLYVPMLHAYPCVNVVEVVSELFITVVLKVH